MALLDVEKSTALFTKRMVRKLFSSNFLQSLKKVKQKNIVSDLDVLHFERFFEYWPDFVLASFRPLVCSTGIHI